MKIKELLPGDRVETMSPNGVVKSICLSVSPHPKYQGFFMVIWKFLEGTGPFNLEFSIDALSPEMELDDVSPQTSEGRFNTLLTELGQINESF